MSGKNQLRARRNGEDRPENAQSPVDTRSDQVNDALAGRVPGATGLEDSAEERGGDLLGYAQQVACHPLTALVASFSIGFGLGVLVTSIFSREEKAWWERQNLPESLHDVASGFRRIPGMIAQHLPDSVARR